MTAVVPDTEQLRELEADTREAWSAYSDGLRELTGGEYERTECESWAELQTELSRLELRLRSLTQPPA
jgi:hypothetical protein